MFVWNKIELAQKFRSTQHTFQFHDTRYTQGERECVVCLPAVCVRAFWNTHINTPRHKYAMDIIELAIKRKAKWISKAQITHGRESFECACMCVCERMSWFFSVCGPEKQRKSNNMKWKRMYTLSIVYTQLVDLHNNSTFVVRVCMA